MKEVVLIFGDTDKLIDFLMETDLNGVEVCSISHSIKSVMSTETMEIASSKYRALKYDVVAWNRLGIAQK